MYNKLFTLAPVACSTLPGEETKGPVPGVLKLPVRHFSPPSL